MGQSIGILDYVAGSRPRYPFRQLMQGDWFDVETSGEIMGNKIRASLNVSATQIGKASGMRFKVQRRSATTIRVWRVDGLATMPLGSDGRVKDWDPFSIEMMQSGAMRRIKCDDERMLEEYAEIAARSASAAYQTTGLRYEIRRDQSSLAIIVVARELDRPDPA